MRWMDRHGVFSQVLYPNIICFHPRAFIRMEPELGFDCIRAYNDFQSEFAAVAAIKDVQVVAVHLVTSLCHLDEKVVGF